MKRRTEDYLKSLVRELALYTTETEWVEFKCNHHDPERIAKYISAVSNAATLWEQPYGYIVWGIEDQSHQVVGTDFSYRKERKGNEELEAWLVRMINPKIGFEFYEVMLEGADGKEVKVSVLEVPCAETEPTRFESGAYIRIGSNLKPLAQHREKEASLWRAFEHTKQEMRIAKEDVSEAEVIGLMDVQGYYDKLGIPIPPNRVDMLQDLCEEKFIRKNSAGRWDITNYGALMIAKDLNMFDNLSHRRVRVIRYRGETKTDGIGEETIPGGYAVSFEQTVKGIMTVVQQEEYVEDGIRKKRFAFPEKAIRELLANMMIHQDLGQRGTSPMVELFSNRIEFSNAGAPLVSIDRIIDTTPMSRNENMAGFMHRCGICEERGSGYDKIVEATIESALLAPRIENQNNQFTRAVLFSKLPFDVISKEDRIRTCYMMACLAYVRFGSISNSNVRAVFGLEEDTKGMVKASRVIKDTLNSGRIKPVDKNTSPRFMRYIPIWG